MFKKLLAKLRGLPPVIPPELKSTPPEGVTDEQWRYIKYLQDGIESGSIPTRLEKIGEDDYGSMTFECEIVTPTCTMIFTYLQPSGMDLWCLWKHEVVPFDEAVKIDYNYTSVVGNNIDEIIKRAIK